MPLIPTALSASLAEAFKNAMLVYEETIANSVAGTDVSVEARERASITFAAIATPAIDLYIRSATITILPGQIVSSVGPTGPVAGATTSPSLPAIII